MKVLIVNAYDDSKGLESYSIFRDLIFDIFHRFRIIDCEHIERRLDNLSDYILDWEHDNLDEGSQKFAKNFDKLDFVFIGGDMKICPWEPVATHVVTLIHMCKRSKKPLFANGFGAFSVVYSLATKGARFHILNGPTGGVVEDLPSFPRYSIGNGAYPSGWLDNETGDIYTFNSGSRSWQPVCNIGVYYSATYGAPPSERVRKVAKKYAREDHLLAFRQKVEAFAVDEDVVHIRSQLLQHKSVRGLEAQNFVVKPLPNWYLNADGALPSGEGLFVIADGAKGPVLLTKENMLLLTCKIDKSSCFLAIESIVVNFVESMLWGVKSCSGDKHSLTRFLFGSDGRSGIYDTVKHREKMTEALARKPVATTLPPGQPVKVDPPAIGMFFAQKVEDDYAPRETTIGLVKGKQRVTVQNPLSVRTERLQMLTTRAGYNQNGSMSAVIDRAVAISSRRNPTEAQEHMPEEIRDLFVGRIMKDNNVSLRRHHMLNNADFKEVVHYEAFYAAQRDQERSSTNQQTNQYPANFVSSGNEDQSSSLQPESELENENRQQDAVIEMPEFEDILSLCLNYTPFTDNENTVLLLPSQGDDDGDEVLATTLSDHSGDRRLIVSEPAPTSTDNMLGESHLSHRQIRTAVPYDHTANFPQPDTPPASPPSHKTHKKHHHARETAMTPTTIVPEITDWYKAVTPNTTQHTPHAPLTSQSARQSSATRRLNSREVTSSSAANGHKQPPPLGVGPDCDRNYTDYVIHTARSARTASTINSALSELYLPHKHPKQPRGRTREDGTYSATESECMDYDDFLQGSGAEQSSLLYSTSQYSSQLLNEQRVVLPTPKSGPYNNFKTLTKTIKQQDAEFTSTAYGGYYRVPYVSETQRPIKDYIESKKKFIAGPFLTHFGQANSAMKPGKEGLVRGQGPFPTEPLPGMPPGITAADWAFLKHNEANKNLAGAWKS